MTDRHEEVVQFQVPLLGSTLARHTRALSPSLSLPAAWSHVRGTASVKPPQTTPRPTTLPPPSETHRSASEILLEY